MGILIYLFTEFNYMINLIFENYSRNRNSYFDYRLLGFLIRNLINILSHYLILYWVAIFLYLNKMYYNNSYFHVIFDDEQISIDNIFL